MDIADFLTPDRVTLNLRVRDKGHLITELTRLAASHAPAVSPATIEAALRARERLGSTGLGAGFALPHARIDGLKQFLGFLVRLARPIDFEAIDGGPVDLLFLLLIPVMRRIMSVRLPLYPAAAATGSWSAGCASRPPKPRLTTSLLNINLVIGA